MAQQPPTLDRWYPDVTVPPGEGRHLSLGRGALCPAAPTLRTNTATGACAPSGVPIAAGARELIGSSPQWVRSPYGATGSRHISPFIPATLPQNRLSTGFDSADVAERSVVQRQRHPMPEHVSQPLDCGGLGWDVISRQLAEHCNRQLSRSAGNGQRIIAPHVMQHVPQTDGLLLFVPVRTRFCTKLWSAFYICVDTSVRFRCLKALPRRCN
mmetsp:Transcript_18691/g.56509  ORF Transcript_18691/g.56509 Transcript_18691/m.56509 type:complete len:212 (-) Transcript_18691:1427-2062(-)